MDILFINPADEIRQTFVVLGREFVKRGHNVTIILSESAEKTVDPVNGVDYVSFKASFVPGVRYTFPHSSFYTYLIDKVQDTDIVCVGSFIYLPCFASCVISRLFRTPVIVVVDCFPGISWSYGSPIVDLIAKLYTYTVGKITLMLSTHVVLLGDYLRDDLYKLIGEADSSVIHNGVSTDRFIPKTNSEDNRSSKQGIGVLYVGRLDPVKNIPLLLKTIRRVNNISPATDFHLEIVGGGSKRDEYEELCDELGISPLVNFEGYQTNVQQYYENNDILVLLSRSEGLPTVLLEAQSAGLPVLVTDVGGVREMIGSGVVVPPEDVDKISYGLHKLAMERSEATAQKARKFIKQNFSSKQMYVQYERLFSKILD